MGVIEDFKNGEFCVPRGKQEVVDILTNEGFFYGKDARLYVNYHRISCGTY